MNITDEILMAYADGELDAGARAEVAAAIARDPALAARLEEHRALRAQLRNAFDPVLNETVPDRLTAAANAPVEAKNTVIDLAKVRQQRTAAPKAAWSWPQWTAMAASLLVGLFIGRAGMNAGDTVAMRNGELFATGTLANALNSQLSNETATEHHIGLTYRTAAGEYCRTFSSTKGGQPMAGVACHEADAWQVRALTEVQGAGADYRMASSAMPAAVRAVVEESMQGEPLGVEEEKVARAQRWN